MNSTYIFHMWMYNLFAYFYLIHLLKYKILVPWPWSPYTYTYFIHPFIRKVPTWNNCCYWSQKIMLICNKRFHKEQVKKIVNIYYFKVYILSHPSWGKEGGNFTQCFVEKTKKDQEYYKLVCNRKCNKIWCRCGGSIPYNACPSQRCKT